MASAPTATWHNDTYPAIDPTRPELSAKNRKIVITGGGRGIGAGIARSFAAAGAREIVLLGRAESSLLETKASLQTDFPCVVVSTHAVSVTDLPGTKNAAAVIAEWDVLVLNAGVAAQKATLVDGDVEDQWNTLEVNVKGIMIAAQAFIPTKNADAVILGMSSAVIDIPAAALNRLQSAPYVVSKIAVVKLLEYLAVENPDVRIISFHPGSVGTTDMGKHIDGGFPDDKVELASDFSVWLASPEAAFLNGKFVWTNWDVDELRAKTEEIQGSQIFTAGSRGWPFSP